MARCPTCEKEVTKPKKSWKYGKFTVQAYTCPCGTSFQEYMREGNYSFTLKLQKGKGYVKVW